MATWIPVEWARDDERGNDFLRVKQRDGGSFELWSHSREHGSLTTLGTIVGTFPDLAAAAWVADRSGKIHELRKAITDLPKQVRDSLLSEFANDVSITDPMVATI